MMSSTAKQRPIRKHLRDYGNAKVSNSTTTNTTTSTTTSSCSKNNPAIDAPTNVATSASFTTMERQLAEGMGELQRIFDSLSPPSPPPNQVDPNSVPSLPIPQKNHSKLKSTAPLMDFDEMPVGVAASSRRCALNPILNPEITQESTMQLVPVEQQLARVVEKEEPKEKGVPGEKEEPEDKEEPEMPQMLMDRETQLRASRFFNLMLARLWRRRKAEVFDLHALVRKYQEHAVRSQSELFTRNQMICREQRRGEQLTLQLMNAINRVRHTMESCADIEKEMKQLREQETKLRAELASKALECEYCAEVLDSCRSEMFRELAKYREGASELANQQRRAIELERQNAQLEDELLTLKDQFLVQNDRMSVAIGEKQEQLDTAYETLKHCEQELGNLEMKYNELVRLTETDRVLQDEITELKRGMGFARNLLFYLSARDWGLFHGCVYHVIAGSLDCLLPNFAPPLMANNLMRLGLAAVFLLAALY